MIPGSMSSSITTPSALYLLGFEMGTNSLLEPGSLIPNYTPSSDSGSLGLATPPSPSGAPGLLLLDKIRSTFFESLNGFLDGLEFLANRAWVERKYGGGSVGGIGIGSGQEEDDKWIGLERWHQQLQEGILSEDAASKGQSGSAGGLVGSNLAYSIRGNGNNVGVGGSRLYLNTSLIERKMEELAMPVYEKLKGTDLVLIGGGAHLMSGISLSAGGDLDSNTGMFGGSSSHARSGGSRWTRLVGGGTVGSRWVGDVDRKGKTVDIRKVVSKKKYIGRGPGRGVNVWSAIRIPDLL
jgi:hypothetical protein